jgi:hypothetical protein
MGGIFDPQSTAPACRDSVSDEAVPIAGTAVVVAVVIPTIALRDSVDGWWR